MRIEKPDRGRYDFEKGWPADVWSIGLDRLDYLGVDESGRLYWNGNRLEIKRTLDLSRGQQIAGIVVALAAVVAAIAASVSAYADYQTLQRTKTANGAFQAAPAAQQVPPWAAAVKPALRDPDSAKFSEVHTSKSGAICGLVNSRNGYGGFTGPTPFAVNKGSALVYSNPLKMVDKGTEAEEFAAMGCSIGPDQQCAIAVRKWADTGHQPADGTPEMAKFC